MKAFGKVLAGSAMGCAADGVTSCVASLTAGEAASSAPHGAPTKRRPASLLCALALAASMATLGGCAGGASSATSDEGASDEGASFEIDMDGMDFDYTDRDKDPSYDAASATKVALSKASATIEGGGASFDEETSTVTISDEGTYVVSGELENGQLKVEADSKDKVQIVLDGASISNDDGPAMYVKQADKCFVTLAEGTQNALADGGEYELEDDSDEPYATLFSKDDLTINGSGSLEVTGAYRHAVCSKDDLVITGGTYVVKAAEDGLRGRDCVKILDGSFTIESGEDAVKSNNDEDGTRGFVCIDGGTFAIDAGDDAVHAESVLVVNGGNLTASKCTEGLEAEQVYINDGDIHVTASDDALNAAARGTSEGTPEGVGGQDGEGLPEGEGSEGANGNEPPAIPEGGMGAAPDDSAPDGTAPNGTAPTDEKAPGGTAPGTPGGDDQARNMPEGEPPAKPENDGTAPEGATPNGAAPGKTPSEGDPSEGAFSGNTPPDGAMPEGELPSAPDNAPGSAAPDAAASSSCLIQINGGYIVLEAEGDGVDSNGNVEITGGVLLVSGPTSNNEGAFDYDGSASITGGSVIMVGSAGMPQGFSDAEQAFIYTRLSGDAGQSIAIADEAGNVIASYTPSKKYEMLLASSPLLQAETPYQLVVGGTAANANADGYADSGTATGGTTTTKTATLQATGLSASKPQG